MTITRRLQFCPVVWLQNSPTTEPKKLQDYDVFGEPRALTEKFKGHGHRAGAAGLASNAIGELWDEEEVSLPCGGMIGSDIFRPDDQRLSKLLEMMAWICKPSIQEPLLLHHHQHQQQ